MTRRRSIRPGFEQRFLATVRAADLTAGQRVVVGFSGGPDSLALAAVVQRTAPLLHIEPLLVHIDHRLRPASAADAAICTELAEQLGLPLSILALEPGLTERTSGIGLEEAARRERYGALAREARAWGADTLLLGHHANDQAETILLHLFRGTGIQGLKGMALDEQRLIPWWDTPSSRAATFRIIRPLLREQRDTIERYLAERGLDPVLDESNLTDTFDRNWIRHQLLPVVEHRWPHVVATLGRSAEAIRLDSESLISNDVLPDTVVDTGGRPLWVDDLLSLDRATAFRHLREWLERIGVNAPGYDVVARVYAFVARNSEGASIEVGAQNIVTIAGGRLIELEDLLEETQRTVPLVERWRVEIGEVLPDSDVVVCVPQGSRLLVRTLQPGDRWFGTRRAVRDDLRAAGIHPLMRSRVLVVTADDGVLLIPAIYPTIRSRLNEGGMEMGVRWWNVEE